MNDIHLPATNFKGDWSAVLNFLSELIRNRSVKKIKLTRTDQSWKVEVEDAEKQQNKPSYGAGLYDLYW